MLFLAGLLVAVDMTTALARGNSAAIANDTTRVPTSLQAAIDKTLRAQPETSPAGLTLIWGRHGTVSFRLPKGHLGSFALRPESLGRKNLRLLSPGPFTFGPTRTTETLGDGLLAWYEVAARGIEQGFTVSHRPSGTGNNFRIVLSSSGQLHLRSSGDGALAVSGKAGPVMTYGSLQVTDAEGRAVPAHLTLGPGQVSIVVDDAGAAYPLTIDPFVAPSSAPTAAFNGSSSNDGMGHSVALSADGQAALVGAPWAGSGGAAYLYTKTAGTWSENPTATFTVGGGEELGYSVAISADGQTVVVGGPADVYSSGAAYIFTEAAGSWPATPTASFYGTGGEALGLSVALSADGETAIVGAPLAYGYNGAAFLYTETGGSWPSSPTASFYGSGGGEFGCSLALSADGQRALVGAYYTGSGNGSAYLYTETGGSWSANPTVTWTGGTNAELGNSVTMSADGQIALVGAPGAGSGNGAAYIYDATGGTWPNTPTTTISGSSNENLGWSVALSDDGQAALLGAPNADSNGFLGNGAAYVYEEVGGTWSTTPAASFTGSHESELGLAVALSADGQTALVGAPFTSDSFSGAANIYGPSGSSWSAAPSATFAGATGATLGYSVALSADGQVALVGAPGAGGGAGAAYVYDEWAGSWSAAPVATFNGSSGAGLGTSVAIAADGEVALVGAPGAGSGDGAAYVYGEPGGSWSVAPVATFNGSSNEKLGTSVALSDDGEVALIGAPTAASGAGAAYTYNDQGGSWGSTPAATFAGSTSDELGSSVALSADGQTALVGAPAAGSGDGAAYLYEAPAGVWPSAPAATFTGTSGETLGASVALSSGGQTALLGAPTAASSAGDAYLFDESDGSWPTTATAAFAGSPGSQLGGSVALSGDGEAALVGAPGAGSGDGAAYLYSEPAGNWPSTPTASFLGTSGEALGWAVALSADSQTALVGAPNANSGDGAAYVYTTAGLITIDVSGSQTYGSSSPTFGYSDDAPGGISVGGTLVCSTVNAGTPIAPSLPADSYTIDGSSCSGLSLSGTDAAAYAISYAGTNNDFGIYAAPLTITPSSVSMTYGGTPPEITPTYSGFVNGDGPASLTTAPTCTSTVTSSTEVGTYASSCFGAADPNYDIYYEWGYVTVQPAALNITASSPAMTYEGTVPAITPIYGGFVNGDGPTALTTLPTCATTATSSSPVGSYPSSCTGAAATDYSISYTDGSVSVGPATLTVTATSTTMTYGAPVPEIADTYTPASVQLSTQPICTTSAMSSSPVGTYPATCSGAAAADYAVGYVAGTVTIGPAPLAITATSTTMTYGATVPPIKPAYGGFVNGDGASSLATGPTCSTTVTRTSPPGTYPATCTGAVDANYDITYAGGAVTVVPAPLSVTASSTTTTVPGTVTSVPGTGSTAPLTATSSPGTTTAAGGHARRGTTSTQAPPGVGQTSSPQVSRLSPAAGPLAGGTTVTIKGKGFSQVDKVRFGAHTARFKVVSAREIIAHSPPGTGTVAVEVTTATGRSDPHKDDQFAYLARSLVLHVSPATGPRRGGTSVVIRGKWFEYVSRVKFGRHAARFKVASANEVVAQSPPGEGTVTISVTTAGGISSLGRLDRFTYKLPTKKR